MSVTKSRLVNVTEMTKKARANKYAIAHINTNNLEWLKAILDAANSTNSPIIVGVSEGAAKYQCGFKNIVDMTNNLMEYMDIKVPVALHLDHGSYEGAVEALKAGFTSVMFDGSHFPFEENLAKTKEIIELAKKYGASVEAEVGTIGGEEDGVIGAGEVANPEECQKIAELDIQMLAAGIGNIHGLYPENWKGLSFDTLKEISSKVSKPLVLHGGTGIPEDQIKKAISLGISKINVNTECQVAFAEATRKYIEDKKDLDTKAKGFDPRKLLKPGTEAIKKTIIEKLTLFGSLGKA
ncbi:class II fructose-1,6-bisphosphate aldolase [Malacoplasma iowae]|uniref:Fructose-1,6-bisphosphate aldolase, class II n=2 Tax=Malacoplasma iowae TaxID=2116 RepID=A0A084U3I2_MALIO|nr:class II fructose-1,6-bisphosphate aldolase [Malacoplasma iowae]VEU62199.1 Fructose-bisphosphate aldolase [Mycoplasmopsis fermentans]EGZ31674.1 fructose-1,6-bisphosphate aldolase, class II [Malacoplasma iowae 695]KFB07518.1 fructose-1,6-bisphosphate aldolase, class II [Malacoplasma iowae DK-CPA]QHG89919.1 class II fructose-1,6-bisphosphate aldolase [Malacoplasma iowae 695]WPL35269.1 class II fructose-1,6-bisphosphate aldolase [Malacoplasma iowae]